MRLKTLIIVGGGFLAVVLLFGCQYEVIDRTLDAPGPTDVSFTADVLPILTTSCSGSGCHIGGETNGVNLTNHRTIISSLGFQYGQAVVLPGNSAESPLLDKLGSRPRFGVRMPLGRPPLSADQIETISDWIDKGAINN